MQKMDNLMKPIHSEIKVLYDYLLSELSWTHSSHFFRYQAWSAFLRFMPRRP